MQLRLARQAIGAVLLTTLSALLPVGASEPASVSDGGEQAAYLAGLKKLYLTGSERQALLKHCNSLLASYALRAGYQVGQSDRRDLLYSLQVGKAGELLVREENRVPDSVERSVRNQRVDVFGVDPFVRYECPAGGIRCVLFNPVDRQPLLTIVRDLDGAAELAKGLTFLIRNIQKG